MNYSKMKHFVFRDSYVIVCRASIDAIFFFKSVYMVFSNMLVACNRVGEAAGLVALPTALYSAPMLQKIKLLRPVRVVLLLFVLCQLRL